MDRRKSNAEYYARNRDRLILRESELRPSTILEILDCLESLELHPVDGRIKRLEALYLDITGMDRPKS